MNLIITATCIKNGVVPNWKFFVLVEVVFAKNDDGLIKPTDFCIVYYK